MRRRGGPFGRDTITRLVIDGPSTAEIRGLRREGLGLRSPATAPER